MEKTTGPMTMENGQPYFRDENGKVREIKSSRDVDAWCTKNALGAPRLTSYTNPLTGERSMQPMRIGGLKPDPKTGEPLDTGAVIRAPETLIPLDSSTEYIPPSVSKTDLPLENGVLKKKPKDIPILGGLVDPETHKPMTLDSCWTQGKI